MKTSLVLMMMAVLASACSNLGEDRSQERFSGRPPAYRDGYADGCKTAKATATGSNGKLSRDQNRYQSDSSYANGWSDGYESCRDSYDASAADLKRDREHPRGSTGE